MAITIKRFSRGLGTAQIDFHGRKTLEVCFTKGFGESSYEIDLKRITPFMTKIAERYNQGDILTMSASLGEAVELYGYRGCPLKEALDKHLLKD